MASSLRDNRKEAVIFNNSFAGLSGSGYAVCSVQCTLLAPASFNFFNNTKRGEELVRHGILIFFLVICEHVRTDKRTKFDSKLVLNCNYLPCNYICEHGEPQSNKPARRRGRDRGGGARHERDRGQPSPAQTAPSVYIKLSVIDENMSARLV